MHYQLFFILDLLGDSSTAKSSVADLSWLGVADYTATAVSENQRSGFDLAWLTTSYFFILIGRQPNSEKQRSGFELARHG